MSDDYRSDAIIKHFSSRSRQPKMLAGGPVKQAGGVPSTQVNIFVVTDGGFGSSMDQVNDNKFRYVGTSPQLSVWNQSNSRRSRLNTMKNCFTW